MKRLGIWTFYAVGALAILYLALYAYVAFTGHELRPGDPIHIFRKPDAPSYSSRDQLRRHDASWPGLIRPSTSFCWA
jgi:hypothetical protein